MFVPRRTGSNACGRWSLWPVTTNYVAHELKDHAMPGHACARQRVCFVPSTLSGNFMRPLFRRKLRPERFQSPRVGTPENDRRNMPSPGPNWFMLGVLVAICLFATVSALAIQSLVGKSAASIAIGPIIVVAAVLIFSWRRSA